MKRPKTSIANPTPAPPSAWPCSVCWPGTDDRLHEKMHFFQKGIHTVRLCGSDKTTPILVAGRLDRFTGERESERASLYDSGRHACVLLVKHLADRNFSHHYIIIIIIMKQSPPFRGGSITPFVGNVYTYSTSLRYVRGIIVVGKPVDRLPPTFFYPRIPTSPSLVLKMQFVITHERWSSLLGHAGPRHRFQRLYSRHKPA